MVFGLTIELVYTIVTSTSAVILSLYNWWLARQGAQIEIYDISDFGAMTFEERKHKYKMKIILMPLNLFNSGSKNAIIKDISFSLKTGEKVVNLFLNKRITGTKIDDIKSERPTFPIIIRPNEGQMHTFEFSDWYTNQLELDKQYQADITVHYGNKKSKTTFPFMIKSDEIKEFALLRWMSLHKKEEEERPPIQYYGQDAKT
ncbi:MAG: hypothetical protein ACFE68_01780 [Candidatus Hodarchaeota archaeon]